MRRLVGIDAGVLDQDVGACNGSGWGDHDGLNTGGAVEAGVDVACPCNFKARKTVEVAEGGDDLPGDHFGGLAELASQFKSDGRREFAELKIGGNLERNVLDLEAVLFF